MSVTSDDTTIGTQYGSDLGKTVAVASEESAKAGSTSLSAHASSDLSLQRTKSSVSLDRQTMLRPAPSAFMWEAEPEDRGPFKRLSAGQLLGMDDYCRKQRVMTPEERELQRQLDVQKTNDTASQTAR